MALPDRRPLTRRLAALRSWVRARPRMTTAALSAVGYALVIGVFAGPITFPALDDATVVLFGDLIALVNTVALSALLAGYWFIRRREIDRHRAAMLTAFGLILVFLALYLWKVGGGFEKHIVIAEGQFLASYEAVVYPAYLLMLAVHILLSALAVPVVLYAIVLGLTHTPAELARTPHARVGRIAVAAWSLSLFLGVVTYLLLNHVYGWEKAGAALVVVAVPAGWRDCVRRSFSR